MDQHMMDSYDSWIVEHRAALVEVRKRRGAAELELLLANSAISNLEETLCRFVLARSEMKGKDMEGGSEGKPFRIRVETARMVHGEVCFYGPHYLASGKMAKEHWGVRVTVDGRRAAA